jgi:hypothetical protein
MKPPEKSPRIEFTLRVYRLLLHAYPARFRSDYGERMARVFADACRHELAKRGRLALIPLWWSTGADLALSASLERWQTFQAKVNSMTLSGDSGRFPLRLKAALAATIVAFFVSLVASINLYLLEDSSSLTAAAYNASALLRITYDGIYLSALAAGVAIVALPAYAFLSTRRLSSAILVVATLLVALGGFGGLLWRHPATFLMYLVVFLALTSGSILLGRLVEALLRVSAGKRSAAVLGACVSAGSLLAINVAALVLHTLSLNPVSHALYMEGRIGETPFNLTLLGMVLALVAFAACVASLLWALRSQRMRRQPVV